MPNVKDILRKIESGDISYEEKLAALSQVEASLQELKAKKEERVKFNVQLIIDEIKKIRADVQTQIDYARSIVPERGPKGDPGERGLDGAAGRDGRDGKDGKNGKDGKDGQDGVSVTDAKIDFDGSLVITLSTGREINVGEVVPPDLAEKIKVTMSTNTALTVQDEGSTLTSGARTINFTGSGVTATASGDEVTVNITSGGGGSGTVTSVSWAGGIVSIATPTTTPAFTIAGTSGGIPYFSSSSTWASSGALTANALMIGGGAGNAPATTTTGTGVVTAIGNAVDAASGLATTTGTATLTNKRVNPRAVTAGATSGNLTVNGDTTDLFVAEGLTGAITFLQPSGTPVDGQRLMIRLEDNGTGRGITWTTTSGAFRAVGITLPTTTTASKVTYVGCVYNATDIFWDAVATVTQA
jgi:hypothetical protein